MFKYVFCLIFWAGVLQDNRIQAQSSAIDLSLTRSSCQTKTQVEPEILAKARAGDYSVDDKKLKAYAFCVYRSVGIIDDAANLQLEVLTTMAKETHSLEKLQKASELCGKVTGSDPNDKAFKIVKCFQENFPEDQSDL